MCNPQQINPPVTPERLSNFFTELSIVERNHDKNVLELTKITEERREKEYHRYNDERHNLFVKYGLERFERDI